MSTKNSSIQLPAWLTVPTLFGITAANAWFLQGLLPVGGQIVLAFMGGSLIYAGLKVSLNTLTTKPFSRWSMFGALLLLCFGSLTLLPGTPDSWVLKAPLGQHLLKDRSELLERAIREGNVDVVAKIARAGVGGSAPRGTSGHPLINAAKTPELLAILLKSGLEPDARDEGRITLLMKTREAGMAQVLVDHGADVNARDEDGRTPLMHVYRSNLDVVKVLVKAGAEVNAVDDFGRTLSDIMGARREIRDYLVAKTGNQLRSGTERALSRLARRDWLDKQEAEENNAHPPSSIRINPDSLKYGERADVEIRLSNDSDHDRVLNVKATLSTAALFVSASHNGKIVNRFQPQLNQQIGWRNLALPAGSSGLLRMHIIVRSEIDTRSPIKDMDIDVHAANILKYSNKTSISLHLQRPLSHRDYQGEDWGAWAVILLFPLSLLVWLITPKVFGTDHPIAIISSRFTAGLFALLCGYIAYILVMDTVRPYTSFQETEAVILDRRFYLTTSSSSSTGSRSNTITSRVPIVAVRYNTEAGEIVSTGLSKQSVSEFILGEFELGDEVPLWYNPQRHDDFVLIRGVSGLIIMGFLMTSIGALVLGWLAIRSRNGV